jgi:hypothetical protein
MSQPESRHLETLNQAALPGFQAFDRPVEIGDLVADVVGSGTEPVKKLLHRRKTIESFDQLDTNTRVDLEKADPNVLGRHIDRLSDPAAPEKIEIKLQGLLDTANRDPDMMKTEIEAVEECRDIRIHSHGSGEISTFPGRIPRSPRGLPEPPFLQWTRPRRSNSS